MQHSFFFFWREAPLPREQIIDKPAAVTKKFLVYVAVAAHCFPQGSTGGIPRGRVYEGNTFLYEAPGGLRSTGHGMRGGGLPEQLTNKTRKM